MGTDGSVFVLAVLVLFITPGQNMAFLVSHALAYGFSAGFAAAVGISLADLTLSMATVLGLSALIAATPWVLDGIRYIGAAYLLYLAWSAVRSSRVEPKAVLQAPTFGQIASRAMITCLLNPKALFFFLIFLPQFVDKGEGSITAQLARLGATLAVISIVFHTGLAGLAAWLGKSFPSHGRSAWPQWMLATVFTALAVRILVVKM